MTWHALYNICIQKRGGGERKKGLTFEKLEVKREKTASRPRPSMGGRVLLHRPVRPDCPSAFTASRDHGAEQETTRLGKIGERANKGEGGGKPIS